jgi:transposase
MASSNVPDYLNLDGFETQSVRTREEGGDGDEAVDVTTVEEVEVECAEDPATCPKCEETPPSLSVHQSKSRTVQDTPNRDGQPTELLWKYRRWKCNHCGSTFTEESESVPEKKQMTERLRHYVRRKSTQPDRTFVSVAEEVGLDDKTVKNVFMQFAKERDAESDRLTAPRVLGIDGVYVNKKFRTVLVSVEDRTILDLLESRKIDHIAGELRTRFEDLGRVEFLTLDMWTPYRSLAQNTGIFRKDPLREEDDPKIVVDKFHIVKKGNEEMDRVIRAIKRKYPGKKKKNKELRGMLDEMKQKLRSRLPEPKLKARDLWEQQEPKIGSENRRLIEGTYKVKRGFMEIFRVEGGGFGKKLRRRAEKKLDEWAEKAERWQAEVEENFDVNLGDPLFEPILRNWRIDEEENWREGILNYFQYGHTNALAEGANGMIKIMNLLGRSYDFPVLRWKIMYGLSRARRELFDRGAWRDEETMADRAYMKEKMAHMMRMPGEREGAEPHRMADRGVPFSEVQRAARLLGIDTGHDAPDRGY